MLGLFRFSEGVRSENVGSRVATLIAKNDSYCQRACLYPTLSVRRTDYRQQMFVGQLPLAVVSHVAYRLVKKY